MAVNPSIQLGTSGNWAIKEDNLLAYKQLGNKFFDREFDFSRGTRATFVGRNGLIQESGLTSAELVTNGDFSQEGSQLITNGSFDSDSGWTLGTGWSIANGNANSDGVSSNSNLATTSAFYSGSTPVKMTINVTDYVSGGLKVYLSSTNFTEITANGNYTFYTTADRTDGKLYLKSINFIGSIDNVSVKEVGQNWTLGTGWSIGDGKAIQDGTGNNSSIEQTGVFVVGKKYKVNIEVLTLTQGRLEIYAGYPNTNIKTINSVGSYTFYIEGEGNGRFYAKPVNNFIGSITNVSVKEIQVDVPRIDFTDDPTGHLLLEPQSTNLFTYSNDFSQWDSFSGSSVINNALVSPDGSLNADEFVFDGTNNGRVEDPVSTTNGLVYTFSIYLKNKDIANPTQVFIGNATTTRGEFVTITNEWQRFTTTQTTNNTTEYPRVRYNGVGSLYAYGAQFEQKSYATSYIPTSGSAVTRNQELCNNSGTVNDFNSEEGVLYAEIAALANDGTNRMISLSDGSTSNVVRFYYSATDNLIIVNIRSGGSTFFNFNNVLSSATDFLKVAISYKLNEFKMYVNGTLVSTGTSGNTPVGLSQLSFNNGASSFKFYGKTKNLKVFKRALTDAELQELTT